MSKKLELKENIMETGVEYYRKRTSSEQRAFKCGDILTEIIRPKQIIMFNEYIDETNEYFTVFCSTMRCLGCQPSASYRHATNDEKKTFFEDLKETISAGIENPYLQIAKKNGLVEISDNVWISRDTKFYYHLTSLGFDLIRDQDFTNQDKQKQYFWRRLINRFK